MNPYRNAINEELVANGEVIYSSSERIVGEATISNVEEFLDSLEHRVQKISENINDSIHKEIKRKYEQQLSALRKEKSVNEDLHLKVSNEHVARNKRLHEEIKKKDKLINEKNDRITTLEKTLEERVYNPLVVPSSKDAKIDFFKDPFVKHLEEEIGFLRSLVTQYINNK